VLKYTFASLTTQFEMHYSTIRRDSGLVEGYARARDAIDALEEAFTELKTNDVLLDFKRRDVTGVRGKLADVVFTLTPSLDFIRDTKAGSKRLMLATTAFQNR
jgi:hypothetical protein